MTREQPILFVEVIEVVVTRDAPFDDHNGWGTRVAPPLGDGWIVADYGDEHATRWERRRLVPARCRS
jgi:hypothetical protein